MNCFKKNGLGELTFNGDIPRTPLFYILANYILGIATVVAYVAVSEDGHVSPVHSAVVVEVYLPFPISDWAGVTWVWEGVPAGL